MTKKEAIRKRAGRVRYKLRKTLGDTSRLRFSVYRSSKHIYAQIIDDSKGHTVAFASTLLKDHKGKSGGNIEAASFVGRMIAERAQAAGVEKVFFDRGPYVYHGRVKALAEAAREFGLSF